ncbi:MAG: sugar transporter substrate-binding protein [Clostridia bacterium]|nr:sugar transporter substrate-binding protein [Clostridia bacterium]
MKMNKLLSLTLGTTLALSSFTGCAGAKPPVSSEAAVTETPQKDGTSESSTALDPNIKATLVFALYDNTSMQLYDELDLEGRFQELYPNVTIELEKSKDDSEYWNSMKIRSSANQLPDIMYNKTFTLSRFKDYLIDLTATEAAKNSTIASGYITDGKILGIPEKQGNDYVYYWEDMFKEAGVEVPDTWDEFLAASKKLQDFYSQKDSQFMGIAIGAKDEWPTYPFMEFMPAAEGGNGQNWNEMAKSDAPFAEGTDVNKAYQKVNKLFTSGVFGKDPLGMGHDQALALFAQRKAAIFVAGSWAFTNIKEGADNLDNLKTFYLPTRNAESDPFRVVTQGDSFMSVTKHSQNPELAEAFLEFYFSDAWYPDYIQAIPDDTTMKTAPKEKVAIFKFADELQPTVEYVNYDGGGDDFQALVSETKFDYKKIGAEMFTPNYDLNTKLAELDTAWAAARAKLGTK